MIAKEKALRCPENHPSRVAAEGGTKQRLKIRYGFRKKAEVLSECLPPEAEKREKFDMERVIPWESGNDLLITAAEKGSSKKATSDDVLRGRTLDTIRETNADVVIYTDGSCDAGIRKGGSAAVITRGDPESPEIITTRMKRGKEITCSYEEEVEAMKLALAWMENEATPNSNILICTDSNSLCDALTNPSEIELEKLYHALAALQVDLQIRWVPAHVNIPGNELADQAAKQATGLESPPLGISFKSIKSLIKRTIKDQPADPAKYKLSRDVYDHYKLTNDNELTTRADQTLIAKIRSGKWKKLRSYRNKLDNVTDPHCKYCPGKEHNIRHWFTECTATDSLRQHFFGTPFTELQLLATEPLKVVQMSRKSLF